MCVPAPRLRARGAGLRIGGPGRALTRRGACRNCRIFSPSRPLQDFAGGHIRGCVNITSDKFYEDADLDAVVLRLRGYKRVVFHCHFSQQRGPFSARRYAARLGDDADTQVCVLHGGWRAWRSAFGDDATLTANE